MHPIEWLRMVARSNDVAASEFAAEAAAALAGLDDDLRGLVPACRRLLERHSHVGPLWWSCARMLSAGDPIAEARQIQADLAAEQVGLSLALDIPERPAGGVGSAGSDAADEGRTAEHHDGHDVDHHDDPPAVAFVGWSPLADELRDRRPDLLVHVVEEGDEGVVLPDDVQFLVLDVAAAGNDAFLVATDAQFAIDRAREQHVEVWAGVEVGRRLPEALFQAMRRRAPGLDTIPASAVDRVLEPVKIGCPCPPELLHLPDLPTSAG